MSGASAAGRFRAARTRRARGPRAGLVLLAAVALGGCYGYPATRDSPSQYHVGSMQQLYELSFVPGRAELAPRDRAALAQLRPALRADGFVTLVADGPLARDRAARVAQLLGRSVAVDAREADRSGPDAAVLALVQPAIVPDACIGAGQPVGRNLWTFDDYGRQRLLPPGCATAAMLLEQAADRRDLLRGRVLEPGAAGPIARAADRYLRRNDAERPVRGEDQAGGSETSEERELGPVQAASPAAGSGAQSPSATQGLQQQTPQERLPPASTLPAPR